MLASRSSDNVGGGAGGCRSRMLGSDGFMAAAIMRLRASMSGFEAGGLAAVPAMAEVVAPGGGVPTMMPGGKPFPAPDGAPPLASLPVPTTLGVPGALGLPPGEAGNSPLRLPLG